LTEEALLNDSKGQNLRGVDLLVYKCLLTSINYCSVEIVDGVVSVEPETPPGKYRSSLDIWRHCKLFSPEITIFEVMDSMWNLTQDSVISCHYCSVVHRTVFFPLSRYGWMTGVAGSSFPTREYKMEFSSWKTINTPLESEDESDVDV
jgi:hypothetical protein